MNPTEQSLRELGVPEQLISFLARGTQKTSLGDRFQPPLFCFSSPIIEKPIIPIWESGVVLVYFDKSDKTFKRASLECPDEYWWSYPDIQSALAEVMVQMYEGDWSDEELREAAAETGFLHLDRLLREVEGVSGDEYDVWSESFPGTCHD